MLFNEQNKKFNDPRYFLNEATEKNQIKELSMALENVFGRNNKVWQTKSGICLRELNKKTGSVRYMEIVAVTGKTRYVSYTDILPEFVRKFDTFNNDSLARVLLQNAEMQPKILMPIITTILELNREKRVQDGEPESEPEADEDNLEQDLDDLTDIDKSQTSVEERAELHKLREENKQLKEKIKELQDKLPVVSSSNPKIPGAKVSKNWQDLEIDE